MPKNAPLSLLLAADRHSRRGAAWSRTRHTGVATQNPWALCARRSVGCELTCSARGTKREEIAAVTPVAPSFGSCDELVHLASTLRTADHADFVHAATTISKSTLPETRPLERRGGEAAGPNRGARARDVQPEEGRDDLDDSARAGPTSRREGTGHGWPLFSAPWPEAAETCPGYDRGPVHSLSMREPTPVERRGQALRDVQPAEGRDDPGDTRAATGPSGPSG